MAKKVKAYCNIKVMFGKMDMPLTMAFADKFVAIGFKYEIIRRYGETAIFQDVSPMLAIEQDVEHAVMVAEHFSK